MRNTLRNSPTTIRQARLNGETPILEFEQRQLAAQFVALGVKQGELGVLLGQAMEQSSETFHDNAPAEALYGEAAILIDQARKVSQGLNRGVIVSYPSLERRRATIGSIVGIQYDGDDTEEHLLLTGFSRELPAIKPDAPFPMPEQAVTISSPLGEAVFNQAVGATPSYEVRGRKLLVAVTSLVQIDPAYIA